MKKTFIVSWTGPQVPGKSQALGLVPRSRNSPRLLDWSQGSGTVLGSWMGPKVPGQSQALGWVPRFRDSPRLGHFCFGTKKYFPTKSSRKNLLENEYEKRTVRNHMIIFLKKNVYKLCKLYYNYTN